MREATNGAAWIPLFRGKSRTKKPYTICMVSSTNTQFSSQPSQESVQTIRGRPDDEIVRSFRLDATSAEAELEARDAGPWVRFVGSFRGHAPPVVRPEALVLRFL